MSLSNSFHMEGEILKVECEASADGLKFYKFVLLTPYEDNDGAEKLAPFDLFAIGTEEDDPWADLVQGKGLHVAFDGEVYQEEDKEQMLVCKSVRHIPQVVRSDEGEDGKTRVKRFKSKEYRTLKSIFN